MNRRRRFIATAAWACMAGRATGLAWGQPARVQTDADEAPRFALLIGNGKYPIPHDLPPIAKNVMDLGEALAFRGFDVTQAMDLNEAGLRVTVAEFLRRVARAPVNSVTFFYYAGHGLQLNANNLLLAAGANPSARRKDLLAQSLVLQRRWLSALPERAEALNMTVIDACRTDLRTAIGDGEGLNQVEAPLGGLVCFSTAAGRPAVSPTNPDQNTFYTEALVNALRTAPDDMSFDEMFRMVKVQVEQTMQAHPLATIRQLAQSPFIADNSRVRVRLGANQGAVASRGRSPPSEAEQADWLAIRHAVWPPDLLRLTRAFQLKHPTSRYLSASRQDEADARRAIEVLRSKEVQLYKTSFVMASADADPEDLRRAARGDKDAAARIARQHLALNTELGRLRFEGWLQYAAGLGNGIASYELALLYRGESLPALAARAEAKAQELGYSPPRSLAHERK